MEHAPKRPSAFSPGTLLLWLLAGVLVLTLGYLVLPYPVRVLIGPAPTPLRRYDDGAGSSALLAEMRITNVSRSTVWYLGNPGSPHVCYQELVNGKWDFHLSSISVGTQASSSEWSALKSGESLTVPVGPVSEAATEMRVGFAFSTERLFMPSKVHWVFSATAKLVKRGEDWFWEPLPGATQEVQVLAAPRK